MTKKSTLLIVDDHPDNLIALDALLSNEERVLITAQSAEEALEILSTEKVDLLLLDVKMPVIDGFELARILKSRPELSGIPILFATADRMDHASRLQGFAEGAIDYLFKPLDPEITRAKVKVLLDSQRQKEELIEKNVQLERSALLINSSADIIGIINVEDLVILEMNPAFTALLGYTAEEYSGRSLLAFLDKAYTQQIEALENSEKEVLSFETRVICKDGTHKWLDWNVVVKNGKWFVNARDRTEIRQLNATLQKNVLQLEAANKELESFSYSVSHDLRAPLRALSGNARILQEDFDNELSDGAKKYLNRILDNAMRMDQLINDLLAFSRIGKKELKKAPVNMGELVRNIFAEAAQEQSHKARIEIQELPDAYGDYNLLKQVWANLISNAIKYSSKKDDPVITVGTHTRGDEVEYYIRDNGAGFNMSYAGKLFGTFQRLHDAEEFEGTGIGLAIVQRIILKHGGSIRAEAAPEQGATFWFKV